MLVLVALLPIRNERYRRQGLTPRQRRSLLLNGHRGILGTTFGTSRRPIHRTVFVIFRRWSFQIDGKCRRDLLPVGMWWHVMWRNMLLEASPRTDTTPANVVWLVFRCEIN